MIHPMYVGQAVSECTELMYMYQSMLPDKHQSVVYLDKAPDCKNVIRLIFFFLLNTPDRFSLQLCKTVLFTPSPIFSYKQFVFLVMMALFSELKTKLEHHVPQTQNFFGRTEGPVSYLSDKF